MAGTKLATLRFKSIIDKEAEVSHQHECNAMQALGRVSNYDGFQDDLCLEEECRNLVFIAHSAAERSVSDRPAEQPNDFCKELCSR